MTAAGEPITCIVDGVELQPNTDEAIAFLQQWPCEMPQLTAIPIDPVTHAKGDLEVKCFTTPVDWGLVKRWIDARQGKCNLYFAVNNLIRPKNSKASKTDIETVVALHVDVDVPPGEDQSDTADEIVQQLLEHDPPPTAVIMSGGGAQGFWLLEEHSHIGISGNEQNAANAERYTQQLENEFKADRCHNVDRIMRLPGTINIPDIKKLEKGRGPAVSKLVFSDWTRKYPLSTFKQADAAAGTAGSHNGLTDANTPVTSGAIKGGRATINLDWQDIASNIYRTISLEDMEERGVAEHALLSLKYGDNLAVLHDWHKAIQHRVEEGPYGSFSDAFLAIATALLEVGYTPAEAASILYDPRYPGTKHAQDKGAERGGKEGEKRRAIKRALEKAAGDIAARDAMKPDDDPRPKLLFTGFNDDEMFYDTLKAMNKFQDKAPVFQQGGRLVHVYRVNADSEEEDEIRRKAGALLIREVVPLRLKRYLEKCVRFYTPQAKGPKPIPIPPVITAQLIAGSDDWPGVRVLESIAEAPYLRTDGVVVSQDGYDPVSRILLNTNGEQYPEVPEHPTQEDCNKALAVLFDVFKEFPFVDEASKSVPLSAVLTGLCRNLMRNAPMHAYDANSAETGKSTLADTVAIIVTGREAPAMSFTDDDIESNKIWLAILIEGDRVISIDNVQRGVVVGGATLDKILTQATFKARILGQSTTPTVSTAVLVQINGNNLMFSADTATRTISARMDAGMERPGERKFEREIFSYAREKRPELVVAALTILRGHMLAGRPDMGLTSSRFKEWDRIVRSALVWAGGADPIATQASVDASDPEKADRAAFIDAIVDEFPVGEAFTAKELLNRISHQGEMSKLRSATMVAANHKGGLTTKSITAYIKRNRDQITYGRALKMRPDASGHATSFWIVDVNKPGANVEEPVAKAMVQTGLNLGPRAEGLKEASSGYMSDSTATFC